MNDLILQRLSDIKEQMGDVRRAQDDFRSDLKALEAKMERQGAALDAKPERLRGEQRWFIGVLVLATLGLSAKVLVPGA